MRSFFTTASVVAAIGLALPACSQHYPNGVPGYLGGPPSQPALLATLSRPSSGTLSEQEEIQNLKQQISLLRKQLDASEAARDALKKYNKLLEQAGAEVP